MAAVSIWKRLLTLLLTLKSIPEYNCNLKMSFIKVDEESHFSFHNLPYGVFSTSDNVSIFLEILEKPFTVDVSSFLNVHLPCIHTIMLMLEVKACKKKNEFDQKSIRDHLNNFYVCNMKSISAKASDRCCHWRSNIGPQCDKAPFQRTCLVKASGCF